MSEQANIDLVKKGYEAFGRRDIPGLLAQLDANVSWIAFGPADLPTAGIAGGIRVSRTSSSNSRALSTSHGSKRRIHRARGSRRGDWRRHRKSESHRQVRRVPLRARVWRTRRENRVVRGLRRYERGRERAARRAGADVGQTHLAMPLRIARALRYGQGRHTFVIPTHHRFDGNAWRSPNRCTGRIKRAWSAGTCSGQACRASRSSPKRPRTISPPRSRALQNFSGFISA